MESQLSFFKRSIMKNIYSYKLASGERLYFVKFTINGTDFFKRGFRTKKDAQAYIAQQYTLANNKSKKRIRYLEELDEPFINYLYQKYKEASAYRYSNVFKRYIQPFFSKLKIESVNSFTIESFNKKINNLFIKSKKDILFIARIYISFLKKYGLDTSIEEKSLYVFKSQFVEPKAYDYYTMDEFQFFLQQIEDPMFYLVFLLLFYYGLRIGELRGLKHSDITGDKVYIRRCVTNKNGRHEQTVTSVKTAASNRDYPLLEAIKNAYQRYLASLDYPYKKDDFIFLSSRLIKKERKVIGETTIKRAQIEYCDRAKLRVIKLHEFRHSCATYLFNKGAEVELVAAWLGHSDSSVTLRVYAHLIPSRKLKLVDFFPK